MTKQEEFVLLIERSKSIYDSLKEKIDHPTDLFFYINSIEELLPQKTNFGNLSFSPFQWNLIMLIMERFLNEGNINHNYIENPEIEIFNGGFIELNEKHSNYWIEDICYFSFSNFYPSMMINIMENDKDLIFSIKDFKNIFNQVFQRYNFMRALDLYYSKELHKEINIYFKMWINMTYGILSSNKHFLNCNKNIAKTISLKCSLLMSFLYHEFTDHIVYLDTDEIYFFRFSEIENRFRNILKSKKYNFLTPRFEHNKSGIFTAKKKFILQNRETNELKIKGIRKK